MGNAKRSAFAENVPAFSVVVVVLHATEEAIPFQKPDVIDVSRSYLPAQGMGKQEKLLEQLADPTQDANWKFHDVTGLLQRLGWEMRVRGSHHFFRKAGVRDIISLQPAGSKAKSFKISSDHLFGIPPPRKLVGPFPSLSVVWLLPEGRPRSPVRRRLTFPSKKSFSPPCESP